MLMVCGPDMVGKTTLCDRIVEQFKQRGVVVERDKFGMKESGVAALPEFRKRFRRWCVSDRGCFDEIPYGMVSGRGIPFTPEEAAVARETLRKNGGLLVVVVAGFLTYMEIVRTKFKAEEQQYDAEKNCRVNDAWTALARSRLAGYAVDPDFVFCVTGHPLSTELAYPGDDVAFVGSVCDAYQHTMAKTEAQG